MLESSNEVSLQLVNPKYIYFHKYLKTFSLGSLPPDRAAPFVFPGKHLFRYLEADYFLGGNKEIRSCSYKQNTKNLKTTTAVRSY